MLQGRQAVRVARHWCRACQKSYSEESPLCVRGSWYGREVHRCAVDKWVHGRSSLRRVAEELRSWIGHQDRWKMWQGITSDPTEREHCHLTATTVGRWVAQAGEVAQRSVQDQWEGIEHSGQFGTDGLWARLRGGLKRVVLLPVDAVTGVVWGMHVTEGEEGPQGWSRLFARASQAGLSEQEIDGLTSDGASGLYSFMREALSDVHHQRCVWHIWRNLAGDLARALMGLEQDSKTEMRSELVGLLHAILDTSSYEAAEAVLQQLRDHRHGAGLAKKLNEQLDRLLYHLMPNHHGLTRVSPEWLWRDFRLRLSHGRNHGSVQHLEQAASLWMVYHNFEPAQWRSERKRRYRYPGQSPLQVAGVPPSDICYLDALEV